MGNNNVFVVIKTRSIFYAICDLTKVYTYPNKSNSISSSFRPPNRFPMMSPVFCPVVLALELLLQAPAFAFDSSLHESPEEEENQS